MTKEEFAEMEFIAKEIWKNTRELMEETQRQIEIEKIEEEYQYFVKQNKASG